MSTALLEWMSFRREGAATDLPPHLTEDASRHVLNDLDLLGHIERDGQRWRVAAPVLAGLPSRSGAGARAVLCGARTPYLLQQLSMACESSGASLHEQPIPGCPNRIEFSAPSSAALLKAATISGLPLQDSAGYTLLACLPRIQDWMRTPRPMITGRVEQVQRFSRSRQRWIASSHEEAVSATRGMFRIKGDYRMVSLLKTSASESAEIDDRVGRMIASAKQRVLEWNASTASLSFPGPLYPPALVARALTLCSGLLPDYDEDKQRIAFSNVNAEMLRLTITITGLRLQ